MGNCVSVSPAIIPEVIFGEPHLTDVDLSEREFDGIVGRSARMMEALDLVRTVGPTNCTVLIEGETGTGKEVIAKAIHKASPRRQKRFVAVNCAAIPAALLESELFGHERGAFTGALNQVIGRFEAADGGTLFLDEIGDLPLELQPKLLRALQEQQFERLGGTRTYRVDVRIIAATNQDLSVMVQERQFRADLFYRLNVFPIVLPSLRERTEDIPLLVHHFIREFASRMHKQGFHISDDAMEVLRQHDWPGNIRELRNFVERATIMSSGLALCLPIEELRRTIENDESTPTRTLADAERDHIRTTLQQVGGVVGGRNGAAAQLGLPRTTLIARMRKLGIAHE